MKTIWLLLLLLFVSRTDALSQQQAAAPKPPVGVPADAKAFNGKWYRVYLERVSWRAAKQRCATMGGQLAIVPDQATWLFLKPLADSASLWLGASDEKTLDLWEWVDGTRVTFTAWLPGEPNHGAYGKEHFIHTRNGGWNDAQMSGVIDDRTHVVGFICEWKNR